jgi:geranylgeranyl diphosphate synthase type I
MEFFERQKESIKNYIDVFLLEKRREFSGVNPWGEDALEKLIPFMKSGKMLRSGLVCLGYEMCKGKISPVIFPAAAAVEFIQTALLIHDDIIDRDIYRRGIPSLFYQYAQRGEKDGVADPIHFGQGMAICLGDIGFFLAFELFSGLKVTKTIKETIIRLWSQELSYVGLAQMQDLYYGETRTEIEAKDILHLYHYKTARYSFSLPLKIGGILGGAGPTLLKSLEKCGHAYGLLFQLKDDELGLFGSEKELGKPVGSDLKECKKTLHYYYLRQKAGVRDVKRFEKICGNDDMSISMVHEVRTMMKKYGVDKAVTDRMNVLQKEVETEIAGLDIQEKYRDILHELLEFSVKRRK